MAVVGLVLIERGPSRFVHFEECARDRSLEIPDEVTL